MPPRVLSEKVIGLKDASRLCPGRDGGPTHWQTLRRWVKRGRRYAGRVVKLEAAHVGTKVVTSEEAVGRFFAACSAAAGLEDAPVIRTPAEMKRGSDAAARELRKMGVLK